MSNLALLEVQHGIYAKLAGDGLLMGMVTGVYDAPPQQAAFPYVVIGDGKQAALPADSLQVTECRLTLHVWTDASGRKPALNILNRLYALLHQGTLTLTGYQLVLLRGVDAQTELAEQGSHMHGMLTILATVVEQ